MKIVESVELAVVRSHEKATNSNATVGSYRMNECCPEHEFASYRVILEQDDYQRLFLLGEFEKHTKNQTGRLMDIELEKLQPRSRDRVNSFIAPTESQFQPVNLSTAPNLALVIVTASLEARPLVIIDGNHRSIAHSIKYQSMDQVPAFVCVHERINQWKFVPHQARN